MELGKDPSLTNVNYKELFNTVPEKYPLYSPFAWSNLLVLFGVPLLIVTEI